MKTKICLALLITVIGVSVGHAQSRKTEQLPYLNVEIQTQLTVNTPVVDFTAQAFLDENGLCAVHHQKLLKTIVPIGYGLDLDPKQIGDKELYPNATTKISGGCVVPENAPDSALVLQCATCIEVREDRWLDVWNEFLERLKKPSAK